jgi:DNA-binding transcriptional MerR regulator
MKKETREKLYKISEVAEILGVHEDTLRNWEKEELVKPDRIGIRGDRRYTAEMIGEIRKKGLVSDLAKKAPANKKDLSEYTKDELIKELQILKKQKKYGLVWEDHTEEVVERCKTEAPILVSKKDKQIKDKDKTKPTNILIEGDNYHALQVLNYTHKGKIDVIYIDPCYNTGNKTFKYNDRFWEKGEKC